MDDLVHGLVGFMELAGGPPTDLTLLINGTLITGTMVRGEEWLDAVESHYPDLRNLVQYLHIPINTGEHVHLKDVNIVEEGVPRPFGVGGYGGIVLSTIVVFAFGLVPFG